jgi:hypothetical protein
MTAPMQLELRLEQKAPHVDTLNGIVLRLLQDGGWWTPWGLCNWIASNTGYLISDSSATARIRDLRKPQYGSHVIEKRRPENSNAFEYRLKS